LGNTRETEEKLHDGVDPSRITHVEADPVGGEVLLEIGQTGAVVPVLDELIEF
jgi:hypothetical protein